MPQLDGVRHSYVEINGFRAHVAEAGDPAAEPLVMLHGWPQHWWCWNKVIPPLAERYRVICPDLRGHGWSDAPERGYDKPQLLADLIALLDELGLDRVRLMGHDWGGLTGFLACVRHPERVERFIALGIAPPFPTGDPKDVLGIWRASYQFPLTAPVIAPWLVSRESFIALVLRMGTNKRGAMSQSDVDLYARALAERPHVTLGLYRTFLTREAGQMLTGRWAGRLTVPTRVVLGEHELVATPDRVIKQARRYAEDMRVHELDGIGHFVPEEAPDVVVERALSFFA